MKFPFVTVLSVAQLNNGLSKFVHKQTLKSVCSEQVIGIDWFTEFLTEAEGFFFDSKHYGTLAPRQVQRIHTA